MTLVILIEAKSNELGPKMTCLIFWWEWSPYRLTVGVDKAGQLKQNDLFSNNELLNYVFRPAFEFSSRWNIY